MRPVVLKCLETEMPGGIRLWDMGAPRFFVSMPQIARGVAALGGIRTLHVEAAVITASSSRITTIGQTKH